MEVEKRLELVDRPHPPWFDLTDPDGNLIALYVDNDEEPWRADPTVVVNSGPLDT